MTGRSSPTVFVQAYGCQMNKLDAELVLSALAEAGYEQTEDEMAADAILFCTCSVRRHAEERVFSNVGALKHLKRRRPETVIGVLGCMAQRDPKEILNRLPHVDIVCGTRAFPRIAEFVEAVRRGEGPIIATDEGLSRCRRATPLCGPAGVRPSSASCVAATTSAPTASCRTFADARSAGPWTPSSRRSAAL